MAEPVLPADEVARIRANNVHDGRPASIRLADSHESLRATVARLRTAAGDLLDTVWPSSLPCPECKRLPGHLDTCKIGALRTALTERGTAPQVPAEVLAEGVLDDAVHETDGSDAYVLLVVKVPEAEYAHHLDARVRVVAADGAPQVPAGVLGEAAEKNIAYARELADELAAGHPQYQGTERDDLEPWQQQQETLWAMNLQGVLARCVPSLLDSINQLRSSTEPTP